MAAGSAEEVEESDAVLRTASPGHDEDLSSLRADGPRERAPDDSFREAIQ
jgi:hypothetical protein